MIIDFHFHPFNLLSHEALLRGFRVFEGYGFYERLVNEIKSQEELKFNNAIDKTIYYLEKANVKKVVLLPVSAKENLEVLDWFNKAPNVFIPFYNPPEKESQLSQAKDIIENAIVKNKIKGFKIMLSFRKKHLNDELIQPVLEAAETHNLPVLFHAGYPPPGTRRSVLTYSNPIVLDEIVNSYPKAKMVIAHMGFPYVNEALALAVQYANIYLDISNMIHMMPFQIKSFLLQAKDLIGVNKILYGSDAIIPELLDMTIEYINNLDILSSKEKRQILGLNAAHLLNLLK